jgi:hypothetical protein
MPVTARTSTTSAVFLYPEHVQQERDQSQSTRTPLASPVSCGADAPLRRRADAAAA